MTRRNIFISHYHVDASIARNLRKCIETAFLGQPHVFLSEDLPPGSEWFSAITNFLKKRPVTIVITTPGSIKRLWVWFEVGASWNAGGVVIPLCCGGMTKQSAPDPLRRLTAVNLTQRGMHALLDAIASHCGCTLDRTVAGIAIQKAFGSLP